MHWRCIVKSDLYFRIESNHLYSYWSCRPCWYCQISSFSVNSTRSGRLFIKSNWFTFEGVQVRFHTFIQSIIPLYLTIFPFVLSQHRLRLSQGLFQCFSSLSQLILLISDLLQFINPLILQILSFRLLILFSFCSLCFLCHFIFKNLLIFNRNLFNLIFDFHFVSPQEESCLIL